MEARQRIEDPVNGSTDGPIDRHPEEQLGFQLLDKSRGGKDGGTSSLTPEGKRLVEAFDHLHERMDGVIQSAFKDFIREITSEIPDSSKNTLL